MNGLKTFGNGRMSLMPCTEFCDCPYFTFEELPWRDRVTANTDVFPDSETIDSRIRLRSQAWPWLWQLGRERGWKTSGNASRRIPRAHRFTDPSVTDRVRPGLVGFFSFPGLYGLCFIFLRVVEFKFLLSRAPLARYSKVWNSVLVCTVISRLFGKKSITYDDQSAKCFWQKLSF